MAVQRFLLNCCCLYLLIHFPPQEKKMKFGNLKCIPMKRRWKQLSHPPLFLLYLVSLPYKPVSFYLSTKGFGLNVKYLFQVNYYGRGEKPHEP